MSGKNYQDMQGQYSHGAQDVEVKRTWRQIIF